jgi:CubicO group peptidase (beta-lactamase class C family)
MKRSLLAAAAAGSLLLVPSAALASDHLGSLQVVTEAVTVPTDGVEVVAVHGVPPEVFEALGADDTAVDVWVDGEVAFSFSYGDTQVVDTLEAGTEYTLAVAPAGSDEAILELGPVSLEDGTSTSVVAHLDGSGNPVLEA